MFPLSPLRLAHGLGAVVASAGTVQDFRSADVDSRRLESGSVFVAVRGKEAGERYFPQALAAGARALVGRSFSPKLRADAVRRGAWLFQVRDGLEALQRLASDQRRLFSGPVLAVTGSNGKSSTKDLLAHLLGGEAKVLSTQGNFNNHLGLPLTLLRARPGLDFAVLEAGMNHSGELRFLGRLMRPDLSLELNVGDAHAGNFREGRAGVARAKEELLEAMGPSGIAVVNQDDPATRAMGRRFRGRVLSFGQGAGADLRLGSVVDRGAAGLKARASWSAPLGGKPAVFPVSVFQGGPARVAQAAAALAAVLALGLSRELAAERLKSWRPSLKLRQELFRLPSGATAIVDAYNASPQSMAAALEFLARSAPLGRRKAVLGCMLELDQAPKRHRALGRAAREAGVTELAALGEQASDIAAGFGAGARVFEASDAAGVAAWMGTRLVPGDWCLFKGSRGLAVERVFQALRGV